ncbi:hypothetical protein [Eubacterium aggregans]|uniref:hypothetical protein n=1 Tax=Eubacterium aggregans TaxID=81409 RepID=UPI003F40F9DA
MKDTSRGYGREGGIGQSPKDAIEQQIFEKDALLKDLMGEEVSTDTTPKQVDPTDGDSQDFIQKLEDVKRSEAEVQAILSALKNIFNHLKEREAVLSRREAILRQEYDKIREMEEMIKHTDLLAGSLGAALPQLADASESNPESQTDNGNEEE